MNDDGTITPAGFAMWYFTYSAWEGRTFYLEDFYVDPSFRGHKIGIRLFKRCAEEAKKHKCRVFNWQVLDTNMVGMQFYQKLGATVYKQWLFMGLDESHINSLTY